MQAAVSAVTFRKKKQPFGRNVSKFDFKHRKLHGQNFQFEPSVFHTSFMASVYNVNSE